MTIPLEQREQDLANSEAEATAIAETWLEARARGKAAAVDAALSEALRELRAADRRLVTARKRIARRAS